MSKTTYNVIPSTNCPLTETLEVNYSCGHVEKFAFSKGFAKANVDAGSFVIKDKCWHCNYKESVQREEDEKLIKGGKYNWT